MTSGSRLEKVGLLRLVEGFHGIWACSRVFQAPSYYSPDPPWFLERLLSEVSAWRRRLPSLSKEVDGLASPTAPAYGA
jgi:hypothetical protein